MTSFEGAYQRYGVQVLGSLISYIGDGALYRWHLVALNEPEELLNASYGKIYRRIMKTHDTIEDCMYLITHDYASTSMLRDLKPIHRVPKELS